MNAIKTSNARWAGCLALLLLGAGVTQAGVLDRLLGSNASSEPLPPEQAFKVKIEALDAQTVIATLTPAPEHYLYRKSIRFALKDAKAAQLGAIAMPRGTKKQDPFFGETEVYMEPLQVRLPVQRVAGVPASFTVVAFYQGCNGRLGVCYPPTDVSFVIRLP